MNKIIKFILKKINHDSLFIATLYGIGAFTIYVLIVWVFYGV